VPLSISSGACVVEIVTDIYFSMQKSTGRETSTNGNKTSRVVDMETMNIITTGAEKSTVEVDMVVAAVGTPSLKTTHMSKTIAMVVDIVLRVRLSSTTRQ